MEFVILVHKTAFTVQVAPTVSFARMGAIFQFQMVKQNVSLVPHNV